MAFENATSLAATNSNKTAANSFTLTSNGPYYAWGGSTGGFTSYAVVLVAIDNTSTTDGATNTITSVTDTHGNIYTKIGEQNNGRGAAAGGVTVAAFVGDLKDHIQTGHVWTVNFSGSPTAKAGFVFIGSKSTTSTVNATTPVVVNNTGADPGSLTFTAGSSISRMVVRVTGFEGNNTSFTKTAAFAGSYITASSGGSAATNVGVLYEFLSTTSTSVASDPTLANLDCASMIFGLQESATTLTTKRRIIT